jgi:hypothetical protein
MRVLGILRATGKRSFCDKRCHTSTNRHCSCVCGGLLHGKGESYAKIYAARASAYVQRLPHTSGTVWLNPRLVPWTED